MCSVRKSCLWLILSLLVPLCAKGQQYTFRSYTQADGLGNMSITALAQDPAGYIWAGTENGLFRFDGARFQRFGRAEGFEDTYVSAIHIDSAGKIWIGTTSNLYFWQGQHFSSVHFKNEKIPVWQGQNLSSFDSNHVLVVSQNILLLLTFDSKTQVWSTQPFFTSAQIKAHPELEAIQSIYATPDGDLWMGCAHHLCQYNGSGDLILWKESQGLMADVWKGLLRDKRGALWIRGDHHVMELPPARAHFIEHPFDKNKRGILHLFSPLVEDAEGRILTYNNSGIIRWNAGHWENVGRSNGFSFGSPTALLSDRDGEIWSGNPGLGVTHWIGYQNWENWSTQQGLPNDGVWAILRDHRGQLHIGTEAGQGHLEAASHRMATWPGFEKESREQIGSLAEDAHGGLWAGTFSGLLLYIDPKTKYETVAAKLPLIYKMFLDNSGRIWFCTKIGIYVMDNPGPGARPVKVENASALLGPQDVSVPNGCQSPSGTVWFASDLGLLRYENGQWSKPPVTNVPPPARFSLIACSADNSLWLGGETPGLWHLREHGADLQTASDQPGSNLELSEVLSLQEDRRGWLWVGTDSGVAVWNANQKKWRFLSQETGLVWNDCNQNALYVDSDNSVWIGTSRGLSHLQRPETLFASRSLQLTITSVQRDGKTVPNISQFALPWSRSSLQFHLAMLSYTDRGSQSFRYRLKGLEKDWVTTSEADVRYAALPPGNYSFQVQGENSALQATSPVMEVSFKILPPWWGTSWFYAACSLAAACIVFFLYRWRLRYVVARQQLLEEIVHQRTQELLESHQRLELLASRDGLTQLWNHTSILEILANELVRCRREHSTLTVVLADLDHFKSINDTYGHLAGDAILREISLRLLTGVRAYDSVGRYGGEEFLLILPGMTREESERRLDDLRCSIGAVPVQLEEGTSVTITCSFGVTWIEAQSPAIKQVIHEADSALYCAKNRGRNRVEYAQQKPFPKAVNSP